MKFSSQFQMNVINNESNFVVNQHKIIQLKWKQTSNRTLNISAEYADAVTSVTLFRVLAQQMTLVNIRYRIHKKMNKKNQVGL